MRSVNLAELLTDQNVILALVKLSPPALLQFVLVKCLLWSHLVACLDMLQYEMMALRGTAYGIKLISNQLRETLALGRKGDDRRVGFLAGEVTASRVAL